MSATPHGPHGPRRVAVVGSGVAGLVAGYVLAKHDEVTLFEAADRLGGHADTHDVPVPGGTLPIDTGFIVHNERTYPILLRLFAELGVATQDSDMSMSVRDEATGLEYAGALGARGIFAQPANLANPRFLRMLVEVKRFHRRAGASLRTADQYPGSPEATQTLRAFLTAGRFSDYFSTQFMTPLVSAVWSCDPAVALDYPAAYLFRFLDHHGMLTVFGSPTWRTVTGGSREYVDRVAKNLHRIELSSPVLAVRETPDGVEVTSGSATGTGSDSTGLYDAVVIATHPDQALRLLADPTDLQREVLGSIRYSANLAQLHTDERLLPRSESARASWNYQRRAVAPATGGRVLVTYDMTRLQRLPVGDAAGPGRRYLVTLGGDDIVDPATVIDTMQYAHPIFDPTSVAAQARLPEIDTARIAFAGAYHGWGFHEDGARSGLRAAEHLGGSWAPASDQDPQRDRPAPTVYRTTIAHARTEPLRHVFRYRSSVWLVDVDDLPAGFEARDHVGDPTASIRENIDALLASYSLPRPARIRLLAHPRTAGHVFNPISVFWCHDAAGEQICTVIEVHNTYGGRHAYVVHPDEQGRAEIDKVLYVSPFNDTSGRYQVLVPEPGDRVRVSVALHRPGLSPFVATLTGTAVPITRTTRLRSTLELAPLLGAARIRYQGIRLWARGLAIQPRPGRPGRPGPSFSKSSSKVVR